MGTRKCTTTRVSIRLTNGWLIKSLTSFVQHTRLKLNMLRGDIEVSSYVTNSTGPVPLVLDLLITEECWGSISDPSLNGHLHYPQDVDRTLNESVTDKIRQYHSDYNNRPSNTISFIPLIVSTSGCLHCEIVCLLFSQDHRETDRFFQFQEFILLNLPLNPVPLPSRGVLFTSPIESGKHPH